MLLAREFVAYISRQLVKRLTPGIIETSTPELVTERITEVITEELSAEDRLNDEVRDLLQLAGEAAHASERLAAPITCWLIARAGISPAEALTVLEQWRQEGFPAPPATNDKP